AAVLGSITRGALGARRLAAELAHERAVALDARTERRPARVRAEGRVTLLGAVAQVGVWRGQANPALAGVAVRAIVADAGAEPAVEIGPRTLGPAHAVEATHVAVGVRGAATVDDARAVGLTRPIPGVHHRGD